MPTRRDPIRNPRPEDATGFMARSSFGPVVRETNLEALQRRVRNASEHPLQPARDVLNVDRLEQALELAAAKLIANGVDQPNAAVLARVAVAEYIALDKAT